MNSDTLPPAGGWLARVEAGLMGVSALAMMAIMLIVVADVAARYALARPFSWSYDMIGLYLMVAMFFLALPDTLTHHGHIAVDVFQHILPRGVRHVGLAIGYGAAALVVGLIGWGGWGRFVSAWVNDDRIAALVALPTWVPYALVVVGSAMLVLRCVARVWGHLAALFTGRDPAGLLPVAHGAHAPNGDAAEGRG